MTDRILRRAAAPWRRLLIVPALLLTVLVPSLWAGCEAPPESTPPPDSPPPVKDELTDLDRYVRTPDPSYAWELAKTETGTGYTAFLLKMKSLTWRSSAEVDRTLWEHDLTIIKPDGVSPGPALLVISGGSNGGTPPSKASSDLVTMAKAAGAIIVELKQVPNQPLTFSDHDGMPHTEDGIIAFSWAQVMKKSDPTWSARFPMVKSSVRAMDTVQAFLRSPAGGGSAPETFIVAGASKRGWTTWLTAAVDKRVVAAVPIVIDVLNVEKFMVQHIESYGFWARSLYDYHYNHVTERIGSKEMAFLMANEDPYLFRSRLTMPKFMVNATGDQFFLPDGSQNYYSDLVGEKYLRYVPNADHSLDGSDALESILAYVLRFREGRDRPKFSWKFEGTDTIRVETQERVQKVLLWQATNAMGRDFRVEKIGKVWQSTELTDQGGGVYVGKVTPPARGYTAFLIELAFPIGQIYPLKFTTQVRVVPEARPFAGMDPRAGKLEGMGP